MVRPLTSTSSGQHWIPRQVPNSRNARRYNPDSDLSRRDKLCITPDLIHCIYNARQNTYRSARSISLPSLWPSSLCSRTSGPSRETFPDQGGHWRQGVLPSVLSHAYNPVFLPPSMPHCESFEFKIINAPVVDIQTIYFSQCLDRHSKHGERRRNAPGVNNARNPAQDPE